VSNSYHKLQDLVILLSRLEEFVFEEFVFEEKEKLRNKRGERKS
jgi:hypothetical protein